MNQAPPDAAACENSYAIPSTCDPSHEPSPRRCGGATTAFVSFGTPNAAKGLSATIRSTNLAAGEALSTSPAGSPVPRPYLLDAVLIGRLPDDKHSSLPAR